MIIIIRESIGSDKSVSIRTEACPPGCLLAPSFLPIGHQLSVILLLQEGASGIVILERGRILIYGVESLDDQKRVFAPFAGNWI